MSISKWFIYFILIASSLTISGCGMVTSVIEEFATNRLEASSSSVEISQNVVVTGNTTTVTLTTRNQKGQVYVSSTPLTVTFIAYGAGTGTISFGPTVDNGDGTYSAVVTGMNVGTPIKIKAVIEGTEDVPCDDDVYVVAAPFSTVYSYSTASATTVAAGGTVNVTFHTYDTNNVVITQGGLPVTFATNGGTSAGTFDAVTDNGDGTYSTVFHAVTAGTVSQIVASVGSQAVTSTLPNVTVTPGAASTIAVSSGNNQSAAVTAALGANLVVVVRDAYNNLVPSVLINWSVSAGGGSLNSPTSTTVSAGTASNQLTVGTTAGSVTITATIDGTSTSTTFTATVTPGAAANIAVHSGNSQTGSVGTALAANFVAVVTDTYSNVISNVQVNWLRTAGGGSLSVANSNTSASGQAATRLTLNTVAGTHTVSATVDGTSITTNFSATATALTTIASVDWQTAPPTSYTASNSLTMATFTARLLDTYGNLILSDSSTTMTLFLPIGTSTLGGTLTRTASSGLVSFDDITYTKAETITVRASENTSGNLRNIAATIAVTPGAATSANSSISASPTSAANDGAATITLTFTLRDAFNNLISNSPVVFASTGSNNTLVQPSSNTNSLGQTTGTITSTTAETKTISITTPNLTTTSNVAFVGPTLSVAGASVVKGNSVTFTVTQSIASGLATSFDYTTADGTAVAGTNYTTTTGSVTIPAGQTSATFSVPTVDTNTNDNSLNFTATISNASAHVSISSAAATGTITDATFNYDFTACSGASDFNVDRSATLATYINSSGVITLATPNTPRFDYDPATGVCRGLLIEPASGNNITQSVNFAHADWTLTGSTRSANLTSPKGLDNTDTAALITEDTGNSRHGIQQSFIGNPSSNLVNVSVYVKAPAADPTTYFQIVIADDSTLTNYCVGVMNIETGRVVSSTAFGNVTKGSGIISPFRDGWYRASMQCRFVPALTTGYVAFNVMQDATTSVYAGNGTRSIYLWGPQAEWGKSMPTSYIPNNNSILVSRGADNVLLNRTLASWYTAGPMTVTTDFSRPSIDDPFSGSYSTLWSIDGGTASNAFTPRLQSKRLGFYAASGGSGSSNVGQVALDLDAENRFYQSMVSINSAGLTYQAVNNVLSAGATLATANNPSAAITRFYVSNFLPIHYRKLVYRPRALSTTKMSTMTSFQLPNAGQSTVTASGPTTADGAAKSTITVTVKNAAGSSLPGYTPTATVSGGTGNSAVLCSQSNMNGVSTCYLTSTSTGTKTITITAPVSISTTAVFN